MSHACLYSRGGVSFSIEPPFLRLQWSWHWSTSAQFVLLSVKIWLVGVVYFDTHYTMSILGLSCKIYRHSRPTISLIHRQLDDSAICFTVVFSPDKFPNRGGRPYVYQMFGCSKQDIWNINGSC